MYELDLSTFVSFIQTMLRLVGGAMRLDPAAFQAASGITSSSTRIILWIVLIAGLSRMFGQSVVLFANHVQPKRFIISLLWGALKFLFDVMVIVTIIWAIANWFGTRPWNYTQVARGIALAAAPYWLSFLILVPYFGMIFDRFLKVYVFLALVIAFQAVFEIPFWDALWGSAIALGISLVVGPLFDRLLAPLDEWINRHVMGERDVVLQNSRQIYEMFAQRDQLSQR